MESICSSCRSMTWTCSKTLFMFQTLTVRSIDDVMTEFHGPVVYGTNDRILPKCASSTFTNWPSAMVQTYRFFLERDFHHKKWSRALNGVYPTNQTNEQNSAVQLDSYTRENVERYLTPARAYSSSLLKTIVFEWSSRTEMLRTPGGSLKSTRLRFSPSRLVDKSLTGHRQKPSAVVPSKWFSVSLMRSCSSGSSPVRSQHFFHWVLDAERRSPSASRACRCSGPFLLLLVTFSSSSFSFSCSSSSSVPIDNAPLFREWLFFFGIA